MSKHPLPKQPHVCFQNKYHLTKMPPCILLPKAPIIILCDSKVTKLSNVFLRFVFVGIWFPVNLDRYIVILPNLPKYYSLWRFKSYQFIH